MQKQALILFAGLTLLSGCAVLKKAVKEGNLTENNKSNLNILEITKNQNVTGESFFITRADVEVSGEDGNEKVVCSIKYTFPGTYLISIRNWTGIEVARIFFYKDSVMINDRINRILYYGSGKQLMEKYGFNQSVIPVILGDYLEKDSAGTGFGNCLNGFIKNEVVIGESVVDYTIDCKILKVITATFGNNHSIKLKFSNFLKNDKKLLPGEIEIEDSEKLAKIIVNIKKIEYPWNGTIEFIPGSKYQKIPLL